MFSRFYIKGVLRRLSITAKWTIRPRLDVELCALLPVLIAAYVWIDDEPQKSEYYKYLYSERAAEIERKGKDTSPVIIKSSNGW